MKIEVNSPVYESGNCVAHRYEILKHLPNGQVWTIEVKAFNIDDAISVALKSDFKEWKKGEL